MKRFLSDSRVPSQHRGGAVNVGSLGRRRAAQVARQRIHQQSRGTRRRSGRQRQRQGRQNAPRVRINTNRSGVLRQPQALPVTRRRMFAGRPVNNYSTDIESVLKSDLVTSWLVDGTDDLLDVAKIKKSIHEIMTSGISPPYFYSTEDRSRNFDEFLRGTFKRAYDGASEKAKKDRIYPVITDTDNPYTMEIPITNVHDLPIYVFFFIVDSIWRERDAQNGRPTIFNVSLGMGDEAGVEPLRNDVGPIHVNSEYVDIRDVAEIYNEIMQRVLNQFPALPSAYDTQTGRWHGENDDMHSGIRVMLYHLDQNNKRDKEADRNNIVWLPIRLVLSPAVLQQLAGRWSQKMEDLLQKNVGTTVVSVRNTTNDKCLIYCLVIGLITKVKDGCDRVFGRGKLMLEPDDVFLKGSYLLGGADDVSSTVRKLTKCLMPPVYSFGESADPLVTYVETIDKLAGTWLSIQDFRKKFEEIEGKLIPENVCGIDVYGIDYNLNCHVYPLYMTKRRSGKIIDLLCVTDKETQCSHFCVINNFEKLMKATKGKQFFSCSKCGACFYHRKMLYLHDCPKASLGANTRQPPGDGGYHFSRKDDDAKLDVIEGVCTKCRLCFASEFQARYHKEHCFMEGKTGYRHVQLVSYKVDEHPTLNGVEIDMEAEEKHVVQRRMMYADFESSINPETGEHSFMSYGLYDWDGDEYKCGYSLDEMFEFILEKAFSDDQAINVYVYFHNAMNYDANFILRWVLAQEQCRDWGIQVIMKSSNRLQKLQFHVTQDGKKRVIHIGDTFLYLTLSLERIVGSIRKDDLQTNKDNFDRFFHIFKSRYEGVSDLEIDHILRKNIFPYRFFTDPSKLDCPIEEFLKIFEPKEENLDYFSESVGVEDLEHGFEDTRHVMDVFRCRTARDYHDVYLCCDVMQLADVFNRSMEILWDSHHIHLTKYLGMPSASWAAFLRFDPTMRIPLYEDTFFAEFFKGMVRGGVTSAALRHAVADEKHSIIYLDVNGLYPYVMQGYKFPCGLFQFVPMGWTGEQCHVRLRELFDKFEVENRGMCFCVDMHFPDDVKLQTDMYPFAPEHRYIRDEYYVDEGHQRKTPFLRAWSEANDGAEMDPFSGLVCTLYDKEKYNVHWRLLRFYMDHGVQITKVWFAVSFEEGDYLAGYIRKNIEIRNGRKDELGKTLYKLLGNSIYGKTFESPFKRCTYFIVRAGIQLEGMINEGQLAAIYPIDQYGWIVKMDGDDIILDKPTYIGACVCEFAKLHMYQLLYDKLMKIFPDVPGDLERGCQMVYTDTDSFIVKVRHPDGVGDGPGQQPLFEYIKQKDPDLIGGIGGQVKSETGDDTIAECIALRSKVYAYKTKSGHIGKRAKGTTKEAQEMQLDWETYKKTLNELTAMKTRNVQFVRNTFKISTVDVYRQSLSVNDGKRYICADGIHTHAFGYPLEYDEAEQAAIDHEYELVCEDDSSFEMFSSSNKKRRE